MNCFPRSVPTLAEQPMPNKRWWIVTFEKGLVVGASRCVFIDKPSDTNRPAADFNEAVSCTQRCLPGMSVEDCPDHNIPHSTVIDTQSNRLEAWIVVEGYSLLDAVIKATGILAQKKGV